MKRKITLSILISFLFIAFSSCKEYCTCVAFAPHVAETSEERLLEKGQTCSDFEVTPEADAGIRCQ